MTFIRSSVVIAAVFAIFTIFSAPLVSAQPVANEAADKILAVIGRNRIVLQSELEINITQIQGPNPTEVFTDSMKCLMLQQIIKQKMLVEQAERDSLVVSEDDVEGTLDNRLRYYVRQYGSREKMEQVLGKTIYQLKDENKDAVKEQMMAEKMQSKLLEHVKITPAEVQSFFAQQSQDSLPFYPATIEVGQIVIDPPTSKELDKYAYDQLADIRKQVVEENKDFETLAGLYSMDPGSRDDGGRINGITRDGGFAPEFVTAAFRLQNGEVSPVTKTSFGYHIIQMIRRKGEQIDVRHILIIPQHTEADYAISMAKLDSIRSQIVANKLSFSEAVGKYSTDDMSKMTGGMIADNSTGSTQLAVDQLDPALALGIDSLKPGAISQPQMFRKQRGELSSRIIYMRSRTEPHKANLKDDYNKIQAVALAQKQNDRIESWIEAKLPTYYLKIDPEYADCSLLKKWVEKTTAQR